uniref:DNA mismatch repair proteins mutS family domain-containing protein n=1 Tax=Anabas testudineus TaxID=64144 RepID=A0A3Q1HA52_ANATE
MAAGLENLRGEGRMHTPVFTFYSQVLLSVLVQHGQMGLCFYDSKDSSLNYMVDTPDNHELHLLARVIQEVSPHVIITSAKQERFMAHFLKQLGETKLLREGFLVLNIAGLEVGKQRLLSAHLLFLPDAISDRDKMSYLSSCISFDSPLMVRTGDKLFIISLYFSVCVCLRAVGALLKCLDRRRVGVELEDSNTQKCCNVHKHKHTYNWRMDAYKRFCICFSVLQIFKSELHPSVYKLHSGEKEGLSLFGILNRCRCKFGSKLLRQWFLRPTQDLTVLSRRQEVIRFFTSPRNSDIMSTLQSSIRNITNIPTILRRMMLSHTKVTDWKNLYKMVHSAVFIRDTVRHLPQSIQLFNDISDRFSDDLHYIASLINRVVDFETSLAENRFTIKPNVDPAIDDKKRRMMGLSDFLTDVARRELEHLDARIPSCCVIYIPLIGFLLSVPRLPSMVEKEDFEIEGLDFMFLSEDRLHYRSQRTKELDDLLGDLHCDIRDMETAVMTQLQDTILKRSASLYKVLDLIAELDCLMAMSSASQEFGYVSPKLYCSVLNHFLRRHPLLELCSPVFVANSFQSSESQDRVKIITGPNSSGKSIYLKQVGLIVFMALIGSDVPAKEADIGLVDGIFTRMQSRESVSVGLSTFMIDLNQMAQALNSSTGNSLVLIDEFGKGTNTVDGLSLLAASISHWLRKSLPDVPHVLLATNFHSLLQLGLLSSSPLLSLLTGMYVCVTNRCRSVVEKFLNLDLEDKDLDLQRFMKEELLPSAGEVLNHR